jgi:bacterioferritin-associated ferredoxin
MYVCICNAVTDRAIREAVHQGVESIEQLTAQTGCAGTCGCCRELAVSIIDETRAQQSRFVAAA